MNKRQYSKFPKTLPALKSRLNFTGSDEQFKKCLNISLSNRGEEWRQVFEMYYGINRTRSTPKKIYMELGITPFTQTKIRNNVLERMVEDFSEFRKTETIHNL